MTISRKIFSATVALPANQATSLYTLMRDSALHWGFEDTSLTTPSMDSILGSEAKITPEATTYLGSDANVRSSASGDNYQGVTLAANAVYDLTDMGPVGMIDPNQIWLYNQSGTNVSVVFQAR